MPLNKTKGNMYDFVTHTWNPIKGRCSHDCQYCYMKRWGELPDLHLDAREMKTDLGSGNYIFVGSSTDMFAEDVSWEWITQVLDYCRQFKNRYLFQTKNPGRFWEFIPFPKDSTLGTTIESDRHYSLSKAPPAKERAIEMCGLYGNGFDRMVTIEPILDFDSWGFLQLLCLANPDWITIGADSQRCNLPEPSYKKVMQLISKLNKFTNVKEKKNLDRLKKESI